MSKKPSQKDRLDSGTQPAAGAADTIRLNLLEAAGGYVAGTADGKQAYRIFGSDEWHPTLRGAIDEFAARGGGSLFDL